MIDIAHFHKSFLSRNLENFFKEKSMHSFSKGIKIVDESELVVSDVSFNMVTMLKFG